MEGEAGEYMKREGGGGEEREREREAAEEPEKTGNGPESASEQLRKTEEAKERRREREREGGKEERGAKTHARSSCRGDCADVRGKVLRRALPDLTIPPLPTRVSSNVARFDSIRLSPKDRPVQWATIFAS